ncbi:MAG TPA: SRPBCC family protein [Actinomycetota bacterium]|nr:SRPBCC family protein [Actinomycetota bacterium]
MLIENEFQVPATIDRAWAYLLDVEEIAPCAPGAELTEVVDDHTWKGKINLKLGPIALSFAGTVTVAERDEANHRVVLKAQGQEQKGKGAASATITSWLEPAGQNGATRVKMQADIVLTGTVAQVSRGLLPDVSARLTTQFADCLRDHLSASQGATAAASSTTPQPSEAIGGIRLGLYAIVRAIGRFFRRLFGRASS